MKESTFLPEWDILYSFVVVVVVGRNIKSFNLKCCCESEFSPLEHVKCRSAHTCERVALRRLQRTSLTYKRWKKTQEKDLKKSMLLLEEVEWSAEQQIIPTGMRSQCCHKFWAAWRGLCGPLQTRQVWAGLYSNMTGTSQSGHMTSNRFRHKLMNLV